MEDYCLSLPGAMEDMSMEAIIVVVVLGFD